MNLSEAYREYATKKFGTQYKGQPHLVNPELKILRAKRKEWERSKSGLSLDEFLRLNKTTI